MKDCCKTGLESVSKIEIWAKRTVEGIVALIVIGAAINQLFNLQKLITINILKMKNLKTTLVIVSMGLLSLNAFSCKNTEKNDVQRNENHMEMNNDTVHHSDDENTQMNHQDSESDKTTNEE